MKLLVGLGNPGPQYAGNRHNIGFMALDAIAAEHGFGPWRDKFQGRLAEGRVGTDRVLALKPATYMNRSGDSVAAAAQFFKLAPEAVIVFHDELDLAPGRTRVKIGGGHAGHNGLRSITAHLGPDFMRVRLGIGHPGDKRVVSQYVLSDFARADQAALAAWMRDLARALPHLLAGDQARFLNALASPQAAAERPAQPLGARPRPPEPPSADRDADRPADPASGTGAPRSALQRLIDHFRR